MKKIFFYGYCLFLSANSIAQTDSSGMIPVVDVQSSSLEQASNILNGRSHIAYASNIEGSGYLINDWVTGNVTYEGVEYRGVQLKYDQYKDELLILHPNGLPIILFTPRVGSFIIANRQFVNLNPGILSGSAPGFYEVLLNGKVNLYAKRKKLLDEKVQITGVTKTFLSLNEYLAVKDGRVYRIKKENTILDLVPEKKQAAKNLLRQNNTNYNSDPESALLTIAQYYNQSSN